VTIQLRKDDWAESVGSIELGPGIDLDHNDVTGVPVLTTMGSAILQSVRGGTGRNASLFAPGTIFATNGTSPMAAYTPTAIGQVLRVNDVIEADPADPESVTSYVLGWGAGGGGTDDFLKGNGTNPSVATSHGFSIGSWNNEKYIQSVGQPLALNPLGNGVNVEGFLLVKQSTKQVYLLAHSSREGIGSDNGWGIWSQDGYPGLQFRTLGDVTRMWLTDRLMIGTSDPGTTAAGGVRTTGSSQFGGTNAFGGDVTVAGELREQNIRVAKVLVQETAPPPVPENTLWVQPSVISGGGGGGTGQTTFALSAGPGLVGDPSNNFNGSVPVAFSVNLADTNMAGTLPVSKGGTGATTLNGVLIGNAQSPVTAITGTASRFLRRNAANTAYEFVTLTAAHVGAGRFPGSYDISGDLQVDGELREGALRVAKVIVQETAPPPVAENTLWIQPSIISGGGGGGIGTTTHPLTAGSGLVGGTFNGSTPVTFAVSFAGTGTAASAARSDHTHTEYLRGDGTNPSLPGNHNFSIGNWSGWNYIQSHSGQALYLNPVGNAVLVGSSGMVINGDLVANSLRIAGSSNIRLEGADGYPYNRMMLRTNEATWPGLRFIIDNTQVAIDSVLPSNPAYNHLLMLQVNGGPAVFGGRLSVGAIGNSPSPFDAQYKMRIAGGHGDTGLQLHANNGAGVPHAHLVFWASEPARTFQGTGIGNNYMYTGEANPAGDGWNRIDKTRPGGYIRFLDGDIRLLTVSDMGVEANRLSVTPGGVDIYQNLLIYNSPSAGISLAGTYPAIAFSHAGGNARVILHGDNGQFQFRSRDGVARITMEDNGAFHASFITIYGTATFADLNVSGELREQGLRVAKVIVQETAPPPVAENTLWVQPSVIGGGGGGGGTGTTTFSLSAGAGMSGGSFNGSAPVTFAVNLSDANIPGTLAIAKGGTGATSAFDARNSLGAAATNQTMFIGYSGVAINRASGLLALSGVSIDGSAGSAAQLSTARTINGTNFNGTAGIETSYWGATRTITIGNTAKSVNGNGNVSWSLAEIGAVSSNHTHPASQITAGTFGGGNYTMSGHLTLGALLVNVGDIELFKASPHFVIARSSTNQYAGMFFNSGGVDAGSRRWLWAMDATTAAKLILFKYDDFGNYTGAVFAFNRSNAFAEFYGGIHASGNIGSSGTISAQGKMYAEGYEVAKFVVSSSTPGAAPAGTLWIQV
jgi:hypothetical protein